MRDTGNVTCTWANTLHEINSEIVNALRSSLPGCVEVSVIANIMYRNSYGTTSVNIHYTAENCYGNPVINAEIIFRGATSEKYRYYRRTGAAFADEVSGRK